MKIEIKEITHISYAVSHPHAPIKMKVYFIYIDDIQTEKYFTSITDAYNCVKSIEGGYLDKPLHYRMSEEEKQREKRYLSWLSNRVI